MKKALKIIGIVLLALLLLMIVLPFAFKGKIIEIVKKEVNKTLTVDVDFGKVGLNLFSEFPYLAVNIHELSAVGREAFVGDTLVYVEKLHLAVNLISIFGDDGIEVRKINIHHPTANLLIDKEGKANWDVVKPSGKAEEAAAKPADTTGNGFKLKVKDLMISNGFIVYDDREGAMKAVLDDLNFRLAGDLTADFVALKLELGIEKLSYMMDGMGWLSGVKTTLAGDIDADLKNDKYTLRQTSLSLNALDFDIDGWVALLGDDIDMDMSLKTAKSDFKNILSLIPALYAKDFADIQTKGVLGFTADVKGKMTETSYPAFDISLLIENAMFKYPDLPKSVDNIQLSAKASSPGGDLDNTIVDVSKLYLEMGNNPFDVRLSLKKPMSNPTFDFMAKGIVNLNLVQDFYPLDEGMDIKGVLTADLTAKGDMKSIDEERYDDLSIAGTLSLADGKFKTEMVKDEIIIDNLNLDFSQRYVHLLTAAKIGRNDIKADGRLANFIGYLLRDDVIRGKLKLNSTYLNINDFMGEETAEVQPEAEVEESTMSVIEIPANIDFDLEVNINQLVFDKIDMQRVSGTVSLKEQTADLQNLSMKALGGDMKVSGAYIAKNPENPEVDMSLKISNVDVQETAKAFVTIQKLLPVIENTTGTISLDFDVQSMLDKTMTPDYNTLNATGRIASPGVKIENIEVLNTLADALKMEKLRKVTLEKFNLSFKCTDGRVITTPFDIKTGNIKAVVSGSTGLDETIDYTVNTKIPRSEFGTEANDFLNNISGNILGTGINVKLPDVLEIPIGIGGTFKKPTVNLKGLGNTGGDLVKDITGQIVEQGKDKVNEQIDKLIAEAKKQRDKLIEGAQKQADKLVAEAQKQRDNLVKQARSAGDAVVAEADKQGQELVKKAGSNAIAKRAAEEGAKKLKEEARKKMDSLVKEAEKQGDKLVDEAKKQGDKLVDEAKRQGDKLIQEAEKQKL